MMQRLCLAVYGGLTWLLQPLVRAKLARRARAEPLYGQHVDERFGYYTSSAAVAAPVHQPAQPLVWLHAVSLGETRAAAILVAQLRLMVPGMRLLLTHSTATGRAEGATLLQAGDKQAWLPWDTVDACQRFLAHFKPRIGVVMETEVWPQLCAQARATGVPMVLANARLNARSLRIAQHMSWLAQPAYSSFNTVLAQTQADASRLRALGAPVQEVLGNLKFDAQRDETMWQQGRAWRTALDRPVVMLAPSREGEEALFLQHILPGKHTEYAQAATKNVANTLLNAQSASHTKLLWLIVPRHPQRFEKVAQLLQNTGLQVARRSSWQAAPSAQALQADVWLGDSMREMAQYYALADVALLGGSFAPLGGHNLIEAIACDCPVVMGPHTFNFDEAANTAQEQGAALRVTDMQVGVDKALQLIGQPAEREAMQQAGRVWLQQSSGTALRTAQVIAEVLSGAA